MFLLSKFKISLSRLFIPVISGFNNLESNFTFSSVSFSKIDLFASKKLWMSSLNCLTSLLKSISLSLGTFFNSPDCNFFKIAKLSLLFISFFNSETFANSSGG
jgi:hypothetical protein